MVWYLLFAHFIADFPLQPNWMVRAKQKAWVLGLHVSIHFLVMLAVVGRLRAQVWPHLLLLASIHLGIDVGKNLVYRLRPAWVVAPYVVDQLLHYLSIGYVGLWIERQALPAALPASLPIPVPWIVLITAYLLVTYVWYITERILSYANPGYRQELVHQFWSRMVARALLLSALLLIARPIPLVTLSVSSAYRLPYLSGEYRLRALFTDIGIACAVLLYIQLAT